MNVGKHTDFTKMLLVDIEGIRGAKIRVIEARAQFCEDCEPGDPDDPRNCTAEYTLKASELPLAGAYDQHFCQEHMVKMLRETPDTWRSLT